MKITTKTEIIAYLQRHPGWVSGMSLEDNARDWQTKASTISRRARELYEEGKIDRMIKGKTVQYSLKAPTYPKSHLYLDGVFKGEVTQPQLFDKPKRYTV